MIAVLLLRVATRPFASLAALCGGAHEEACARLGEAARRLEAASAGLEEALHAEAGPRSEGGAAPGRRVALLALRRAVHNRRALDAAGLERAKAPPVLAEALSGYAALLARTEAAEEDRRRALATDLARGRAALAREIADPLVAEGIALASRSLASKAARLSGRDPDTWDHGDRHVAAKALAYVARFATKTSPNGVFCATALARAEGDACRVAGAPGVARRDVILSVAETRKVACTLAFDPAAERAVVPRVNPTLREDGGAFTVWTFASARNPTDDETLARVKDHPVLRLILDEAARRTLTLPELRRRVAARADIPEEQIAPFLRQVIERGILVAEIEIPYNERRPLRFVASRAAAAGCAAAWVARAEEIESEVDRLPGLDVPARLAAMERVAGALEALPRAREIRRDELFRLDATAAVEATLPGSVLDDLRAGLAGYVRLFAALYPARRSLEDWVARFLAKFPADTEVELTDVYRAVTEDKEVYRPAAFPEPARGRQGDPAREAMDAVRRHLIARARETSPGEEIALDEPRVAALLPGAPAPRWACGVLFQVAAEDAGAVEHGRHRLVLNGLFHGAGLSLSRFAHLLGGPAEDDTNPVVRELRRAWSIVARPGAVVAELTYNHLGRTANAGLRPAIFDHEIELPGDRATEGARALGLRDLLLRWDTHEDRFVLRWPGGGMEVLPVINSGVNPVGFVSLLVAIGEQGLQPIGYFPGFDDPSIVRWPRVAAGRLVLFRERFTFRSGGWPEPPERGDDLTAFARDAAAWRERHGLPRYVFVHTSKETKPRYRDLASPLFLDLLRRDLLALRGETAATLHVTEMFPGPGEMWIAGPGGGHASEFLVQMSGPGPDSGRRA